MRTETRNTAEVRRSVILPVYEAVGVLDPRCYCRKRENPGASPCRVCLRIRALYTMADILHGQGFNL
jgi:hypothetical protein